MFPSNDRDRVSRGDDPDNRPDGVGLSTVMRRASTQEHDQSGTRPHPPLDYYLDPDSRPCSRRQLHPAAAKGHQWVDPIPAVHEVEREARLMPLVPSRRSWSRVSPSFWNRARKFTVAPGRTLADTVGSCRWGRIRPDPPRVQSPSYGSDHRGGRCSGRSPLNPRTVIGITRSYQVPSPMLAMQVGLPNNLMPPASVSAHVLPPPAEIAVDPAREADHIDRRSGGG